MQQQQQNGRGTTRQQDGHPLDASSTEKVVYVVKRDGELLQDVARRFGVRIDAVRKANSHIRAIDTPRKGDVIVIPPKANPEYVTFCEQQARVGSVDENRKRELLRWNTMPDKRLVSRAPAKLKGGADGMRLSEGGFQFIKGHEALRLQMYDNDGSATGNCTIGYGHKLRSGKCTPADRATYPNGITEAQAEQFLRQDVTIAEGDVKSRVTVPLTQNQFDALTSFAYNMGGPRFGKSSVLRVLNERRYDAVPGELATYARGGGGLAVRRKEEGELFSRK